MPRRPWLSIMGLYKYDESIFDGFRVPASIEHNKQAIIDTICMECAEFELVYPNFDVMQLAIRRWTDIELPIWTKLQETQEYEYNPIWNKDAYYEEKEERDLTYTRENDGSSSDNSTSGMEGVDIESVQGFNDTEWANARKQDTQRSSETSSESTAHNEGTDTDTGTIERNRREYGNIGVMSTQTLIKEQREVVDFSVESYIVNSFKKKFCLTIY